MEPQDIYKKYLESAIHFLSFRPRSEKEVRENLIKKRAPSEICEQIIKWLKEQRFIHDEDFTRWWIEQRSKFRPKALRIIKLELRQKGISTEIIDTLTNTSSPFDSRQEFSIQTDLESAKQIVEKKIGRYKGAEKKEIYRKLGAHLARKGFDWDTIKRSIDEVSVS